MLKPHYIALPAFTVGISAFCRGLPVSDREKDDRDIHLGLSNGLSHSWPEYSRRSAGEAIAQQKQQSANKALLSLLLLYQRLALLSAVVGAAQRTEPLFIFPLCQIPTFRMARLRLSGAYCSGFLLGAKHA
ncbi:hypothetical protein [Methylocystis echinoides]|uniref:hypothetical protein n=1 Tax=Methylocystis echinoides TaxID=29468 RepID=UPI00248FA206|nr:hypothetical protein [Methylocystis echinoides]